MDCCGQMNHGPEPKPKGGDSKEECSFHEERPNKSLRFLQWLHILVVVGLLGYLLLKIAR